MKLVGPLANRFDLRTGGEVHIKGTLDRDYPKGYRLVSFQLQNYTEKIIPCEFNLVYFCYDYALL